MKEEIMNFESIQTIMANEENQGKDVFELAEILVIEYQYQEADSAKLLADWFFFNGQHVNCLIALSYYYAILDKSDRFTEIVWEYYHQNIEECRNIYEHNRRLLKDYDWYYGNDLPEFDTLQMILIHQDDYSMIYIDRHTGEMNLLKKDEIKNLKKSNDILFAGGFNHVGALKIIQGQLNAIEELWAKRATYFYYETENDFCCVLQSGEMNAILQEKNIVIFIGWNYVDTYLSDTQSMSPDKSVFGSLLPMGKSYDIKNFLEGIAAKKDCLYKKIYSKNKEWYKVHKDIILENVRKGKPKILFLTSLFTTILQYHTRDCMEICERLGCEVALLKEQSDIHRLYDLANVEMIYKFKPDIVFCIDHFRMKDLIPPEIIWVCWAQDPLDHILDKKTPGTLIENDYILNHVLRPEQIKDIGYDNSKILRMPVMGNHLLYTMYALNDEEKLKYQTDICLVAHASSYQRHLREFQIMFSLVENVFEQIKKVFDEYYQLVYHEEIQLKSQSDAYSYLREKFAMRGIVIEKVKFNRIALHFYTYTRPVIFRSVLAEWLIDGGYTDLKLYGNDWGEESKFKAYSVGTAPNGEPLAKIYQASKITLGTNILTTGAARTYECYLSGGFYIANYIDPEEDIVNVRDYFEENNEIPFFYGRQDLYNKLNIYLDNEKAREKIKNHVREKMLKYCTVEVSMKRMLQWLKERNSTAMQNYINRFQSSLLDVEAMDAHGEALQLDGAIEEVMHLLADNKKNKRKVFFIGNGGSAGIASHMETDFFKNGGMRSQSLHESSTLTCLGNDFGYKYVFSRQLELLMDEDDVLFAISSSGNSPNILSAVGAARDKQGKVITLSGFDAGNKLRQLGDFNFYVPIYAYGIVESIHTFILQMIVDLIVEKDGVALK